MNEQHEKHAADAKETLRNALDDADQFGPPRAAGAPVAHELLLGDADVAASGDEPYPLPQPAVEQAAAETATEVATVRDEMSLRVANMASDGAAHFLLNVGGAEVCGACGKPFPCPGYAEIDRNNLVRSAGEPVDEIDAKARAVAELLNVPLDRARQMVLTATPLDEL